MAPRTDLEYAINHVFLPPKLPQKGDLSLPHERKLCEFAYNAARTYRSSLSSEQQRNRWVPVIAMLKNLGATQADEELSQPQIVEWISNMNPLDHLAFFIRAQNAGVILRKRTSSTIFEFFEVSPKATDVMATKGKLLCSYPGPAIEVPASHMAERGFIKELASFLVKMNVDALSSEPISHMTEGYNRRTYNIVVEARDTPDPRYITELLVGILRGTGKPANVTRISKRISDDVLWKNSTNKEGPWRRSSIWTVIRVALQTTLGDPTIFERGTYKSFMIHFMTSVLEEAVRDADEVPGEILYCMRAKISRRLLKIGGSVHPSVIPYVERVGKEIGNTLQGRWTQIQQTQATSPPWQPDELHFNRDISLSLDKSKAYISNAMRDPAPEISHSISEPKHSVRYASFQSFFSKKSISTSSLSAAGGGVLGLSEIFKADPNIALADFELAVERDIDGWIAVHSDEESVCKGLHRCITKYHHTAKTIYASNPENLSIMYLTILELWVALDKIACEVTPFLNQYPPEVPATLLQPLLIRRRASLVRVAAIEQYLRARHTNAIEDRSIFGEDMDDRTFAVRFYQQSLHHQSLKAKIEAEATALRQRKERELVTETARYQNLIDRAQSKAHDYVTREDNKRLHVEGCRKCALEEAAEAMSIAVHEWPLPTDKMAAEALVVELDSPVAFGWWRATTYQILRDIYSPDLPKQARVNFYAPPSSYAGLEGYFVNRGISRLSIASSSKPFTSSNYASQKLPTTLDKICVESTLHYRLLDQGHTAWALLLIEFVDISKPCTLLLPRSGPYQSLQYAVTGTTHTSNEVLANQSDCPKDLSLHEHNAFGIIRSGGLIQWLNILRELAARSLSLHRDEVFVLLTQASCQVGPSNETSTGHLERDWHVELNNPDFGGRLLDELHGVLRSIESNWLEGGAVRTMAALASRLLASVDDADVEVQGLRFLRDCRGVSHRWMRQLAKRLNDSDNEAQITEFQQRLWEIAATCRATYDVDPELLHSLLSTSEDVAIALECAIYFHDNTPADITSLSDVHKQLIARDRRLAQSLELLLRSRIERVSKCLDDAIASVWSSFTPTRWTTSRRPNDRWLTCETASVHGQTTQTVQFNLLEGLLLINGKPLGRLPKMIVQHPTYTRIFGRKVLDVIPSDMAGMEFATRSLIQGHQVFFALRDEGKRLVIRTKCDSEVLELIPHTQLDGDFPILLVKSTTHWLNLATGKIEFRALEERWRTSARNWWCHFSPTSTSLMRQNSTLLVDIRSQTLRMVSSQLEALESPSYIIVTYNRSDRSLIASLPRFRLSFKLNESEQLESQNLPGMIVDSCQSAGCFFGLKNYLILRPKDQTAASLPRARKIIVPQGKIHADCHEDNVAITIETGTGATIKYFTFEIDTDLGQLVGNVTLHSTLIKAYLHALSSYCLPDPLTGKTGTEEALVLLRSAGCHSFQTINNDELDLLHSIGSLTPKRAFYPADRESMQTVTWNALPSLSQHHDFYSLTATILDYAESLAIFGLQLKIDKKARSDKSIRLSHRAAIRTSVFRCQTARDPSNSGRSLDCVHFSRDQLREREEDACEIAKKVLGSPSALKPTPQLFEIMSDWKKVAGPGQDVSLSYSRQWLKRDLSQTWISLYDLCRNGNLKRNRFRLLFSLPAMFYGLPDTEDSLIETLIAFTHNTSFSGLSPPLCGSFNLPMGITASRTQLVDTVNSSAIEFWSSPEAALPASQGESRRRHQTRRDRAFAARKAAQAPAIVDSFMEQWPRRVPQVTPVSQSSSHFKSASLTINVRALFESWWNNKDLYNHIRHVQSVLNTFDRRAAGMQRSGAYMFSPCVTATPLPLSSAISLHELFTREVPTVDTAPHPLVAYGMSKIAAGTENLSMLLAKLQEGTTNSFHRLYANDLEASRIALDSEESLAFPQCSPYSFTELTLHRDDCQRHLRSVFNCLLDALSPQNPAEKSLLAAGLWPRITPRSLFSYLARPFSSKLPLTWERAILTYAQAFIQYQRAQRLVRFALSDNLDELYKELVNPPSATLSNQKDWLLIQLDGDFVMRPVQAQVLHEMVAPSSGANTVMQLNMGEGKSSVIIPMAAAAIGDGVNLARVFVLKPLAGQMFQMLVKRLSGLANRQVYYMPFSRSVKPNSRQANLLLKMYRECMGKGGILVVQPEHTLSFKLMTIDRLLSPTFAGEEDVAATLLETQKLLEEQARDILDESDEILHVRYQLIYTIGEQQQIQDNPDRWTTIQQVFWLVRKYIPRIVTQFPSGVEFHDNSLGDGAFPYARILSTEAGVTLVSLVVQDVMDGGLPNFPFERLQGPPRPAVNRFITQMQVDQHDLHLVEEYCKGSATWSGLLLLRGLFVHGLLVYVMKERRWRVDYGPDPRRTMLAVPYRAKDVPSPRAEFGHPDVAISLTCLSFYYGGLTEVQLLSCFELLYQLDNPALEYARWVRRNDAVPATLLELSGVNTRDFDQRSNFLIPLFRKNHAVIDFFLSEVVFPREAKEFPHKLSTSGWDLAEEKTNGRFTTGFSGTNDNQHLLPTTISQRDIPRLKATNAKILAYLLQPENDYYICVQDRSDPSPSAKRMMQLLVEQRPEIRVLLDVGAQMLEMQTEELAKYWLELRPDMPAVVFFQDDDQLVVMTRDGVVESLITSPFNGQLGECLVYLDDAHTRGTDLKFPRGTRAAVTLGPKVTKDRLVQGCMRMRKLGHGQSVMFFAPLEVDMKIRAAAGKADSDTLGAADILRWVMMETCADIQHHAAHFVLQGVDHRNRKNAWDAFLEVSEYSAEGTTEEDIDDLRSAWLQFEARTLQEMYAPASSSTGGTSLDSVYRTAMTIPAFADRCQKLGIQSASDTQMEEEQEREVDHEAERERHVERPPKATPSLHKVHSHIRRFVTEGKLPGYSKEFVSLFAPMKHSHGAKVWAPNLLATKDFATTVTDRAPEEVGDYLRPVNWIVSTNVNDETYFVVLSPYEVNELLPLIRQSPYVHLHVYSPRVTMQMQSFDHLNYYCIPPLPASWKPESSQMLVHQLNLWAGQLYLSDHDAYLRLCEFLGVATSLTDSQDTTIQQDGFILPEDRRIDMEEQDVCPFSQSPLPFLKEITGLRRKGMGYLSTHMGKILHGRLLTEADFET